MCTQVRGQVDPRIPPEDALKPLAETTLARVRIQDGRRFKNLEALSLSLAATADASGRSYCRFLAEITPRVANLPCNALWAYPRHFSPRSLVAEVAPGVPVTALRAGVADLGKCHIRP